MRGRLEGWVWLAVVAVCWVAVPSMLYPTYDDGWNLHLLRRLAAGDWQELWHHGSPLFYLFYVSIYQVLPFKELGYEVLATINSFLGFVGIYLVVGRTLTEHTPKVERLALSLLVSLTPLALVNRGCLTVEAAGLLLLGLSLWQRKRFWQGFWLGCAVLWNYKLGLVAGVCFAYYGLKEKDRWSWLKSYGIGFATPGLALYSLYALANPVQEWWRPGATYLGLFGRNAAPGSGSNVGDVFFYLQYLFNHDAWHLWVLGLFGLYTFRKHESLRLEDWIILAVLVTSFALPKAPRWLLPALPLLAGYVLPLMGRIPYPVARWVVRLSLAVGAFTVCESAILPYVPSRAWYGNLLPSTRADRLLENLSYYTGPELWLTPRSALPYLEPRLERRTQVQQNLCSDTLKKCHYQLGDGYVYLLGQSPESLCAPRDSSPTSSLYLGELPTNAIPLVWLEHAEYTGLSYGETMARWQRHNRSALQVRVVRVACP